MFKKLKNRFFVVMAITLVAFIALGAGLGNLTLTQGGEKKRSYWLVED